MIVQIKNKFSARIKAILDGRENSIKLLSPNLYSILERGLLYPSELSHGKILFLGINPSFRVRHDQPSGFNSLLFEEEISNIPEVDRYVYFKVFSQVCKDFPWTHYDIFPFREKNQNILTSLLFNQDFTEFREQFLSLSKEIIEMSKPKIIVVSNAFLRNLFHTDKLDEERGTSNLFLTTFSDSIGTHVISSGSLKDTPIFFTSMLSGQRALDVGSRERLQWHIRRLVCRQRKWTIYSPS